MWKDMIYRIYQLEKGEKGTEHYQGFVIFKNRKTLNQCKQINNKCHWERTKGSKDQARDYCMKEDTRLDGPWEEGNWEDVKGSQGNRSDLEAIKTMIDNGSSLKEVYDAEFNSCSRCFKFVKEYKFLKDYEDSQKLRNVEVSLYWGVPGAGKTYKAYIENPGAYILRKGNGNNLWFPGYDRQKTIIFDDFDGTWMSLTTLLRLLDKYPLHVEDKGSSTPACWTKVIITSNLPVKDWYPEAFIKSPERLEAVERRIQKTIFFDKKYVPGPLDHLLFGDIPHVISDVPKIPTKIFVTPTRPVNYDPAVILDTDTKWRGNTIPATFVPYQPTPENHLNIPDSQLDAVTNTLLTTKYLEKLDPSPLSSGKFREQSSQFFATHGSELSAQGPSDCTGDTCSENDHSTISLLDLDKFDESSYSN